MFRITCFWLSKLFIYKSLNVIVNMYCPVYDNIGNELHSLLSTHDVVFKGLNDRDKVRYLLTLENETTSKILGKYTYLIFQKRKDILNAK